jgi:hypothetical protein
VLLCAADLEQLPGVVVKSVACGVVLLASLYLIFLAIFAQLQPVRARQFLLGFAGSAGKHYAEQVLRLVVGVALVICAPGMLFTVAFTLFGWVILFTSLCLLLLPWRWHQRFAQRVVPPLLPHIRWIGLFSALLGATMLLALLIGPGASA